MLPDQRLTTMLETAEEQFRADPQFLDGLFGRLVEERDARRGLRSVRSLPASVRLVAALAAVLVVVVLGSIALQRQQPGPAASPSPSASASPSPAPSATAGASVAALAAEQLTWCLQHTGGPGADQHQVEDMALIIDAIPSATSRADVVGHWNLGAPAELGADPTFVNACRAAYVTLSSAAPPSASVDPLIASIRTGMTEFDHAVTAARGPLGITDADQSRLFQLEDAINGRIDAGDLAGARTNLDQVISYLAGIASRLDTDGGRRLQAAVDALDGLIPAG